MKELLIILSIIGLLKLVSLFVSFIIKIYYRIVGISIDGVRRDHDIYKCAEWCLIPTICFIKSNKYFEVTAYFLCFKYYCAYSINKDDE